MITSPGSSNAAIASREGDGSLSGLHGRFGPHDVHPCRFTGLEEVARVAEPFFGEGERLLSNGDEGVTPDNADVLRGHAEEDAVLGGADTLLGRTDALLGLVVGPDLPHSGEDRL